MASRSGADSANLRSIHSIVTSVGRLYIHEIRPSAKKFLERAASREVMPSIPSVARTVIEVIGIRKRLYSSSEPSSSGFSS